MGISSFNKSIVEKWEFVTSSSPSGLTTITLSSIDTIYAKLLIKWDLTNSPGNNTPLTMRLNNDSGNNYISTSLVSTITTSQGAGAKVDSLIVCYAGSANTSWKGFAIINQASTSEAKIIEAFGHSAGDVAASSINNGFYAATSPVNRIDLLHNASLSGSVNLYGVRA